MVWVAVAGIAFQVLGLGVAVQGFRSSYEVLDPDRSFPRDIYRLEIIRFIRKILRRKTPQHTVLGVAGSATGTAVSRAFVTTRPAALGPDASSEDRQRYIDLMFDALSKEMQATRRHNEMQLREVERRLRTQIGDISKRLDSTTQDVATVATAAFGSNGAGLRQAALGLAITAIGVVITAAGLPW